MPNRLANETSPYLLQHKDNPVDWYPWGDEAFQKAKQEGKAVFLSVGYSSCHWCHVMEHESFEDEAVAELLNKHFVSVKVDREERPDVDEAYMTAVQLSSGRGGWPMSVFMTPDRKPFFAGTYFPKEDRSGYPGFKKILTQIASAWATKRRDLEKAGDEFDKALRETLTKPAPATFTRIDAKFIDNAIQATAANFDPANGGTVGAPKFPPHTSLELLMRYALQAEAPDELRQAAIGMALLTLEKMCLGGIHDQVGGGFHRYSTDEKWVLPHFEKMLYDNALMLGNLARGAIIASQLDERLYVLYYRSMTSLVGWLLEEMTSSEGLFYSALDADSEGEEGKFYVWSEEEVRQILGDKADGFLKAFNFEPDGNFHDEATKAKTGLNIPYLTESTGIEYLEDLRKLADAREKRVRPGLDDKAIVGWNGLMISALIEAGIGVGQAQRAAEAILQAEKSLGSLPHQIAKGRATGPAFLEDYAFFASSLFALASLHEEIESGEIKLEGAMPQGSRGAQQWRDEAGRLVAEMIERFYDEERGGFFSTASDHEELFGRTKQAFDQPLPSPNSIAIRCLLEVGEVERARKSLESFIGWMERAPTATEGLYIAAMESMLLQSLTESPVEAAVVEAPKREATPEVQVRLESKELRAGQDGRAEGKIVIQIPEGLHINSTDPPARWLIPTKVSVEPLSVEVRYPRSQGDRYEGNVTIPFVVTLPQGESGADFEVKVSYQACTESECLLPRERSFTAVAFR